MPIGNLERGCESAEGCHFNGPFDNGHNPGTAHPALDPDDSGKQDLMHWYGERIPFVDGSGRQQIYLISHYNAGNLEGACTLCHGAALDGGTGPACTDCHIIDAVADPTKFDALFIDAYAAKIAANTAFQITASASAATEMESLYQQRLATARSVDAQESETVDETDWLGSRY